MTRAADSFAYTYDPAGNVLTRSYPGVGPASYGYDDDGRLASVTRSTQATTYFYDEAAELIRTALPNATRQTRSYDRAGRLSEVRNERLLDPLPPVALSVARYGYDPVGNPTTITRDGGTELDSYDTLDRLTEVCYAAASSCGPLDPFIRYGYDAVGNRTAETRPSGTTSYSYDSGDELLSRTGPSGTVAYSYDQNGNETAAGTRSFAYDLADRLTSTTDAGTTTTDAYDGDGTRLEAVSGSSTTKFLWDDNLALPELALERDGSGSAIRSYLHGAEPISFDSGGQSFYLHTDGIGSVVGVTSASGTPQWS